MFSKSDNITKTDCKTDISYSLKNPNFQFQSLLFVSESVFANEHIDNFNSRGENQIFHFLKPDRKFFEKIRTKKSYCCWCSGFNHGRFNHY